MGAVRSRVSLKECPGSRLCRNNTDRIHSRARNLLQDGFFVNHNFLKNSNPRGFSQVFLTRLSESPKSDLDRTGLNSVHHAMTACNSRLLAFASSSLFPTCPSFLQHDFSYEFPSITAAAVQFTVEFDELGTANFVNRCAPDSAGRLWFSLLVKQYVRHGRTLVGQSLYHRRTDCC